MGEMGVAHRSFVSKPVGKKNHLEELGADESIILKFILRIWVMRA